MLIYLNVNEYGVFSCIRIIWIIIRFRYVKVKGFYV